MSELVDSIFANLNENQIIEFTQELIRIPSYLWHESNLAFYIADWLKARDFEVEVQTVPLADGGETHQVVGRLKGDGTGPSLLLCGHLDTSDWQGEPFRKEEWKHDPFGADIENGYLYGLGAINMKSGDAAILMAADLIRRSNLKLKGDLIVACVVAETGGGVGAEHLIKTGVKADYCIVTEASDLDLGIISVGSVGGKIKVKGQFMHRVPYVNPILKMAKVIQAFGEPYTPIPQGSWLRYEPHPLLPGFPAMAVRDVEHFQDTTTITFDLRMIPGMTEQTVREDMQKMLEGMAKEDPDFKFELIIPQSPRHKSMHARPETPVSSPVVQRLIQRHTEIRGQKPVVGAGHRIGATTDAAHFKGVGMVCVEYGPGYIPVWPMVDECIEVQQIIDATKILALTAADLLT